MEYQLLTASQIAIALASEIHKRLSILNAPHGNEGLVPSCSCAQVGVNNLYFSTQHLLGTAEDLMKMLAPQLDEAVELLIAASDGQRPIFLKEPELPRSGCIHSEAAQAKDVRLRYVRSYDINTDTMPGRIDFRVVGIRWRRDQIAAAA